MERMQSLKEITKQENINFDLKKNYEEASKNSDFVTLVQALKLTNKEAMRLTSKLEESLEEKKNCKNLQLFFKI